MRDTAGEELRQRVLTVFRHPVDEPVPDEQFNELALAVFAWQFQHNPPFEAFCRRRGRTPGNVADWTAIPAVPTAAFRYADLVAGDAAVAQAAFRTSGTTFGRERRGTHHVLDLQLYHGSLLPGFAAYLLPDGARPVMLSLMPAPAELPDSSLAHMIGTVLGELGPERSGWYATVAGGIDTAALAAALRDSTERGEPVCLLGTSLAFLHWLELLERQGERFRLPEGSRLMDTGGYKGRGRVVPVAEMLRRYEERLGIGEDWCVNEYGMTELCSQQYDAQLRDTVLGRTARGRLKVSVPWLRTRIVNPETLEPLPDGREGLLQHFDLANLNSVSAVQTEDTGVRMAGGIRLTGRVLGATPRGCSIGMEDLLRAARGGPQ